MLLTLFSRGSFPRFTMTSLIGYRELLIFAYMSRINYFLSVSPPAKSQVDQIVFISSFVNLHKTTRKKVKDLSCLLICMSVCCLQTVLSSNVCPSVVSDQEVLSVSW